MMWKLLKHIRVALCRFFTQVLTGSSVCNIDDMSSVCKWLLFKQNNPLYTPDTLQVTVIHNHSDTSVTAIPEAHLTYADVNLTVYTSPCGITIIVTDQYLYERIIDDVTLHGIFSATLLYTNADVEYTQLIQTAIPVSDTMSVITEVCKVVLKI